MSIINSHYSMQVFIQDWKHCDQTSNYFAQLVGASHPLAKRYINLLSTILNEVLEIIFRQNKDNGIEGSMAISIKQEGDYVFTTFDIPVNDSGKFFFTNAIDTINQGDTKLIYRRALQALANNSDTCPQVGLYDVAANYDVNIDYQTKDHDRFAILIGIHYGDIVVD